MTKEFIDEQIKKALAHQSGLDPSALEVPGFSTKVMKHLWNNLCSGVNTYLEVGAYFGGTACAAINNNPNLTAIIIENGSQEFHGRPILRELEDNLNKHGKNFHLSTQDFFETTLLKGDKGFDFFFYDAHHAEEWQRRALPEAFDCLSDTFIYAVDDYNWESVWRGTDAGFDALGDRVELIEAWTLRGEKVQDDEVWHNGLLIALCKKT